MQKMTETVRLRALESAEVSDRHEPRASDRRLMWAARRGSGRAIEELVDRHWDRAHRIAYGIVGDLHAAEDVTQEAMLSVLANIGHFDALRPFEPWLHRIVSNRALDFVRSRARRNERYVGVPGEEVAPRGDRPAAESGSSAGDPAASLGGDSALATALAGLSPDHRAVVILRFVAGYGPKEIGRLLEIPTGTVGSRLERALAQLRIEMEDTNE